MIVLKISVRDNLKYAQKIQLVSQNSRIVHNRLNLVAIVAVVQVAVI